MKAKSRSIDASALYTVEQAASLLCIHPVTLRKKLRCGLIPGKRRVGQWRMRGSELLNLA